MSWILLFFSAAEHEIRLEIHNTFFHNVTMVLFTLLIPVATETESIKCTQKFTETNVSLTFCSLHLVISSTILRNSEFIFSKQKKWRIPFYLLVFDFNCSSRFWFSNFLSTCWLQHGFRFLDIFFLLNVNFYFMPKWGTEEIFIRRHNTQHQYEMNEKVFDSTERPFHFQFFTELLLLSTFTLETWMSEFSRVEIDFSTNDKRNTKAPFAHARWNLSYENYTNLFLLLMHTMKTPREDDRLMMTCMKCQIMARSHLNSMWTLTRWKWNKINQLIFMRFIKFCYRFASHPDRKW